MRRRNVGWSYRVSCLDSEGGEQILIRYAHFRSAKEAVAHANRNGIEKVFQIYGGQSGFKATLTSPYGETRALVRHCEHGAVEWR